MAAGLDTEQLRAAFQARPDLIEGIQRAADSPARVALFNNIASFVCDQTASEPSLKRRRVDDRAPGGNNGHANGAILPSRLAAVSSAVGVGVNFLAAATVEPVLLEIKEISLSIPLRKKFDLCFTKSYLYARAAGGAGPVQGIVYAWKEIEHVFYVPVPEKAQVQYSYILFPHGAALAALAKPAPNTNSSAAAPEPLVFTVPATAPRPGSVGGASAHLAEHVSDSYSTLLHWALETQMRAAGSRATVVSTNPALFHSVARQAYRPSEKAVHVRAFRGSKDGYLFFLPTGILWGFKKPLLFLPLDRIVAFSYTSVLQRTFNIVVEVDMSSLSGAEGDGLAEVEFGMIDQEDYGGIDETYVRRHGLQDQSMAEQRKAKLELAENAREGGGKVRKGQAGEEAGDVGGVARSGGNGDNNDDEMTELQRAEKQLQDDEDDLEEDYDPSSGGYSDGSGTTSEEEEEDGEDEEAGDESGGDAEEDEENEAGFRAAVKEEEQ